MSAIPKCLSILDVGHGNSAVLVDDNGIVVIDAGPGSALLEFLQQEGIHSVDVLLLSHADKDHIEGLVALIASEEFHLGRIRLNTDSGKSSKLWDDLLYALKTNHEAKELDFGVSLTTDDTGKFDQGSVHIEILAPNLYVAGKGPGASDRKGRQLTTNSVSAVIRLVQNGEPIALFTGDLDEVGLDNMMEDKKAEDCKTFIAVFPHHGGKPGPRNVVEFAKRFCEIAKPRTVVFSIGRGKYDTPRPEIVAAVREALPDTRIVCTQLSNHCSTTLPTVAPEHLTDKFAQGREQKKCCGGTLVIRLAAREDVLPLISSHQEFIKSVASNPLCMKPLATPQPSTSPIVAIRGRQVKPSQ